jgi:hypothetical protein
MLRGLSRGSSHRSSSTTPLKDQMATREGGSE